jgi:hypothetical protein
MRSRSRRRSSLRAQRSNPARPESLDCFVALAPRNNVFPRGASMRPSFANHHATNKNLLELASGKQRGRRSAERRMPSTVRAAYSDVATRTGRARKRILRDALAFRRFTAALATPVATSIGSAPEPGFPRQAKAKCFARLHHFGFRHLLAFANLPRLNALRVDRSLCRSTGDPGPPGGGSHSSARRHRTCSVFRKCPRERRPSMSKIDNSVPETGTIVKLGPLNGDAWFRLISAAPSGAARRRSASREARSPPD